MNEIRALVKTNVLSNKLEARTLVQWLYTIRSACYAVSILHPDFWKHCKELSLLAEWPL